MATTEADFRTRLQDWLPKLVLAPSFAVTLLFVYGFILFTVVLSFTGSKMLPRYDWVGFENYQKLFALPAWTTAITNIAIFATLSMLFFKQFGVGLAVAILIDATIVRAVLLPATMKLLGDWNWYLPSWLQWLPRLEHHEPVAAPETRPASAAA